MILCKGSLYDTYDMMLYLINLAPDVVLCCMII